MSSNYEIITNNNHNIKFTVGSDGICTIDNFTIIDPSFNNLNIANKFVIDSNGDVDTSGNVLIKGNLTVKGTTTRIETSNQVIKDSIIELSFENASSPTNDAGIVFNRGDLSNACLIWNENLDRFQFGLTNNDASDTTILVNPFLNFDKSLFDISANNLFYGDSNISHDVSSIYRTNLGNGLLEWRANEQYFQLSKISNTEIGLDSSANAMFKDLSATNLQVFGNLGTVDSSGHGMFKDLSAANLQVFGNLGTVDSSGHGMFKDISAANLQVFGNLGTVDSSGHGMFKDLSATNLQVFGNLGTVDSSGHGMFKDLSATNLQVFGNLGTVDSSGHGMFKDLSATNLQVFGNLGTVDSSGHGMFKDLSAANLQVFGNLGTVDSSGHGMFKDLSAANLQVFGNLGTVDSSGHGMFKDLSAANLQVFGNLGTVDSSGHGMFKDLSATNLQVFGNLGTFDSSGHGMFKDLSAANLQVFGNLGTVDSSGHGMFKDLSAANLQVFGNLGTVDSSGHGMFKDLSAANLQVFGNLGTVDSSGHGMFKDLSAANLQVFGNLGTVDSSGHGMFKDLSATNLQVFGNLGTVDSSGHGMFKDLSAANLQVFGNLGTVDSSGHGMFKDLSAANLQVFGNLGTVDSSGHGMFKDLSATNLQVFGNLGTVDSSGHGMFKDLSAANLQVFGNLGTIDSSGHGMFKDLSATNLQVFGNLGTIDSSGHGMFKDLSATNLQIFGNLGTVDSSGHGMFKDLSATNLQVFGNLGTVDSSGHGMFKDLSATNLQVFGNLGTVDSSGHGMFKDLSAANLQVFGNLGTADSSGHGMFKDLSATNLQVFGNLGTADSSGHGMFKDLSAANLQVFGNLGTVDSSGHGMFKDLSAANLQVFGNLGTVDSSGHGMFKDLSASKGFFYENLKVPKGTTSERPTATSSLHHGYIRYNTTLKTFEGFAEGNVWKSLDAGGGGGGVIDSDQDTYITAEDVTGGDDDELKFYTAGNVMARIDTSKFDVSCGMTIGSGTNFSGTASPPSNGLLVEGIVGIGATDVFGALQVGNASTAIGGTDITADVSNALIVIHPTNTSNTTIDDPKTALYLGRNGTTTEANPAGVFFKVCRASNTGTNSKSRLDINLRTNWTSQSHVMTLLDSGNVGIGTTTPEELVEAKGNLYLSNYVNSGSTRTGGKLFFDASFDTGGIGAEGPQKIDLYDKQGHYGFGIEGSTTTYFSTNKHKWYTTDGTTATARMMLDSDKLGIGTSSPGTMLQIEGTDAYITLKNSTAENTDGGAETKIIFEDHSDTTLAQIQASHDGTSDDTKGDFIISTNNGSSLTEALRIDSSQYVGIGTNAPAGRFHVSSTVDTIFYLESTSSAITDNPYMVFKQQGNAVSSVGHSAASNQLILANQFSTGGGISFRTKNATNSFSHSVPADERMFIDGDGNVGIGTSSPGTMLQIEGTDAYITLKNSTAENTDGGAETKIIFEDHSDTTLAQIQVSHDGTSDDTKGDFIISTNNGSSLTEALRIDSSQYVGIGTTTPSQKLEVEGNIMLNSGSYENGYYIGSTSYGLRVSSFNLDACLYPSNDHTRAFRVVAIPGIDGSTQSIFFQVSSNGNVGIGNTSPSYKLDVTGDINFTGNLRVSGTVFGLNNLSDVLVENNSLFLGTEPSSTNGAVDNVSVGINALESITTGDDNIAIGKQALKSSTTDSYNTAVGYRSMYTTNGGGTNTALGHSTLYSNVSGGQNVAIGYGALYSATGGSNTAVGYEAGEDNAAGTNNTSVGRHANNTGTGSYNTTIGANAGTIDSYSGSNNVLIGYNAEPHAAAGTNQIVIGYNATGVANDSVTLGNDSVTAVYMAEDKGATVHAGGFTMCSSGSSVYSLPTADGQNGQALVTNGSGTLSFSTISGGSWSSSTNSAIYYNSGFVGIGTTTPESQFHITGSTSSNTSVLQITDTGTGTYPTSSNIKGTITLEHETNGGSTSILFKSAKNDSDYGTIYYTDGNGTDEKGILTIACKNDTTGGNEDQIRFQTYSNTDRMTIAGDGNVGIGTTSPSYKLDVAGDINFTGTLYQNGSAFSGGGASSLNDLTDVYFDSNSSRNNLFVGSTPSSIQSGAGSNTATGVSALDSITSGDDNTAFGKDALTALASGHRNTAIGSKALQSATYRNNTGIGNQAGSNLLGGENNIMIGFNAQGSSNSVSNEITLGNSSNDVLRCKATSITSISDIRDKKNIVKINKALEFTNKLNPIKFDWNCRDGSRVDIPDMGFIAQELKKVQKETNIIIPGLVYESNPDKLEAAYGKLLPILTKAIQELSTENKAIKEENLQLKNKVDKIMTRLEDLGLF